MRERTYRVLAIDDSPSILQALAEVFAKTSYEFTGCRNPLEAYGMIENDHFDIVISDIMMPEMDGLTLLRKIKNFNGTVQVIIITGYISINNTLNAFRYGANDIFFKPLKETKKLIGAVDEAARKLDRISELLNSLASKKGA